MASFHKCRCSVCVCSKTVHEKVKVCLTCRQAKYDIASHPGTPRPEA